MGGRINACTAASSAANTVRNGVRGEDAATTADFDNNVDDTNGFRSYSTGGGSDDGDDTTGGCSVAASGRRFDSPLKMSSTKFADSRRRRIGGSPYSSLDEASYDCWAIDEE